MYKPWTNCYLRPGLFGRVHIPQYCANCLEPAGTQTYGIKYPHMVDFAEIENRLRGEYRIWRPDMRWVVEMLWIPVCDRCIPNMISQGWLASLLTAYPVKCVKIKGVYTLRFRSAEWAKMLADANDTTVMNRHDLSSYRE